MKNNSETAAKPELRPIDKQAVTEFFKLLDQWEKNERKENTDERACRSSSMET